MKKIALLLLAASASLASAVTINVGKGLGSGVTALTTTGTALPASSFQLLVGTFTTEPVGVPTSIASLLANFKEFGRATSSVADAGRGLIALSTGITAAPAQASDFNTLPIYVVVGNGATFESSTEIGVIKGLSPAAGTWAFPANVQAAGSVSAPMNDATRFQVVGGIGTKIDNASGVDSLQLVAVPEPGVSLLAFASIGLLTLRRRR